MFWGFCCCDWNVWLVRPLFQRAKPDVHCRPELYSGTFLWRGPCCRGPGASASIRLNPSQLPSLEMIISLGVSSACQCTSAFVAQRETRITVGFTAGCSCARSPSRCRSPLAGFPGRTSLDVLLNRFVQEGCSRCGLELGKLNGATDKSGHNLQQYAGVEGTTVDIKFQGLAREPEAG